jgi:hypothetical protein
MGMKLLMIIGLISIILTMGILTYRALSYHEANPPAQKNQSELFQSKQNNRIPLSPIVSIIALTVGVIVVVSLAIPEDCRM